MIPCPPGCAAMAQRITIHVRRHVHHIRHFTHAARLTVKAAAIVTCAACPAQSIVPPTPPSNVHTPPSSSGYIPSASLPPPAFEYVPSDYETPNTAFFPPNYSGSYPTSKPVLDIKHALSPPEFGELPPPIFTPLCDTDTAPSPFSTMPEPSSMMLLLSAFGLLLWRKA